MRPFTLPLFVAVLAGTLVAQCPPERLRFGPIDCDSVTGVPLNLGCQYLNGSVYVSGAASSASGPYSIFVLDQQGVLLGSFPQPAAVTSGFGLRDGASDESSLFFGSEQGIFAFDPSGNPVTTIFAANGPQTPALPITGPGLAVLGNYRALAYDPSGNGGNGSFYAGNFGSDVIEIDLAGNVLNTLTNSGQWSAYGLALMGGQLWVNDDGAGRLAEIDRTTGLLNGRFLRSEVGTPGGLSEGPETTLVWLDQGTSDEIFATAVTPFAIPDYEMLTGADGSLDEHITLLRENVSTFSFDLAAPAGTPYQIYFNAGLQARRCADSRGSLGFFFGGLLPGVKNFYTASAYSNPSTMLYAEAPAVAGSPMTFNVPIVLGALPDGLMRVQGLYLDPAAPPGVVPIRSSTEGLWDLDSRGILGVTVSADGPNSFNSDTTSGYFQISNASTDPMKAISSVTLDYSVNLPDLEFDTDQAGIADIFEGGNSTLVGCAGTYRNGSDLTTGLVYGPSNTVPAAPCDPAARTGFLGANELGPASYQTLTFQFSGGNFFNGAVLEFDCDTDGGGISGDANAGLVITVTTVDGSTRTGVLAVSGPERAEVLL